MRGRPGCPTEQEKNSVEATGGSPPFLFLQGKVGYRIAPSSDPASPAHLPPKGKALGVGRPLPVCKPTPPSPPSWGAGRYGRWFMGRRPGKKRRRTPAGSPQTRKGGSREEEPLPPWCSFLRLSSKESRAPRRSRRGPRGAAPQGGFGATYPKGTYPPFPGEEPLISPGAAAGYPPPKTPGRGTPPGAGRPPGPSTAGGCPRGLSWRRSPCASRR